MDSRGEFMKKPNELDFPTGKPTKDWENGDGATHEAGFNLFPGSNQVFREFRKLLSLRRASLSKVQYYQQIAPYLYPLTELARATNWPVVFFQDN